MKSIECKLCAKPIAEKGKSKGGFHIACAKKKFKIYRYNPIGEDAVIIRAADIDVIVEEIKAGEPKDVWEVEIDEMSFYEYDNLSEHDGWEA